jgi:hypothetical protein
VDEFDEEADCIASYYAAVAELRRRYLAGEELPEGWRPPGYRQNSDAMSPWER